MRESVSNALKFCLHYNNFDNISIYKTATDFIKNESSNNINLIDSDLITPFINKQNGDISFSILAITDDDSNIADALHAGAVSFINLSKGPAQFVKHVQLLAEGKTDEPSQLVRTFLKDKIATNIPLEQDYNLTKKEIEVLIMMRDGKHLKLIAQETKTSYETVRTHVKHLYKKLGVMSASEAVLKALKMKL